MKLEPTTIINGITSTVLRALNKSKNQYRVHKCEWAFLEHADKYEVNTVNRICMFWSQIAHETGGYRWFTELGNEDYFKKYDGRKDLGNTEPGDGYRFRGRGLIMLTGRANYTRMAKKLNLPLVEEPDLASEPNNAVLLALEYWKTTKCNEGADIGSVKIVTKKINGGYNGLNERQGFYDLALQVAGEKIKLLEKFSLRII